MNEETKLPDGLELADKLLEESDHVSEAVDVARDAIRAEHAQRLKLQHRACDLAQRVADLEAERNNTAAHITSIARQIGDEALQVDDIAVRVLALAAERDAAQQARRDAQALAERYQAERNAAGVQARREVAEQIRALTAERDELRATLTACAPHLTEREDGTRHSPADMLALREREVLGLLGRLSAAQMQADELRAKYDELLVALHGIGRALGLAEGARSPYSITCGVLERVNRPAEIEAQEPVAWVLRSTAKSSHPIVVTHRRHLSEAFCDLVEIGIDHLDPLYARPVPAIPEGWKLVPLEPTADMITAGRTRMSALGTYMTMIAAAPEYKA